MRDRTGALKYSGVKTCQERPSCQNTVDSNDSGAMAAKDWREGASRRRAMPRPVTVYVKRRE